MKDAVTRFVELQGRITYTHLHMRLHNEFERSRPLVWFGRRTRMAIDDKVAYFLHVYNLYATFQKDVYLCITKMR